MKVNQVGDIKMPKVKNIKQKFEQNQTSETKRKVDKLKAKFEKSSTFSDDKNTGPGGNHHQTTDSTGSKPTLPVPRVKSPPPPLPSPRKPSLASSSTATSTRSITQSRQHTDQSAPSLRSYSASTDSTSEERETSPRRSSDQATSDCTGTVATTDAGAEYVQPVEDDSSQHPREEQEDADRITPLASQDVTDAIAVRPVTLRRKSENRAKYCGRRSFTTEDLDVFQRKNIRECLEETNDDMFLGGKRRSSGLDGGQSADSKKDKEKSRRRSRSLSSLTNLKISLHVPSKPKVPSKPNLLQQFSNAVSKSVSKNSSSKSQPTTPTSSSLSIVPCDIDTEEYVSTFVTKSKTGESAENAQKQSIEQGQGSSSHMINDKTRHKNSNKLKLAIFGGKKTKKGNYDKEPINNGFEKEYNRQPGTKLHVHGHLDIDESAPVSKSTERSRRANWVEQNIKKWEQKCQLVEKPPERTKSDSSSEVSQKSLRNGTTSSKSKAAGDQPSPPYENIPSGQDVYPNIEIKKDQAGRNDLVTTNIYDNNLHNQARRISSENRYEPVEFQGNSLATDSESRDTNRSFNEGNTTDDEVFSSEWDSDIDFADDSNSEVDNEEQRERKTSSQSDSLLIENTAPMSKPQQIANEILTTERAYVKRLHLVDQVFHFRILMENRLNNMFPDTVIPEIFSNIKSIYQFHHDFLLPQLEKRMNQWDITPRIGDLIMKFAPFLKLYTEYVKNFDNSRNVIMNWTNKSPRFNNLLAELQSLPECGLLTLQHHMLEPIQRVPRYQLLLKDYIKHLPEGSTDLDDTQKALDLVTTAAKHSNDIMRKTEQFSKLLELNDKFGGMIDLISPTRELIKDGRITKISARNGDHMDRHIFLFSDMIILASAQPGLKTNYKVRTKMEMDGMEILEGDNLETPDTFYVRSKQKTIELHTSDTAEKTEWLVALAETIADYMRRKLSRIGAGLTMFPLEEEEVGTRAPTWIKDQDTSMCMRCTTSFTRIRRRHHCRACGIVVCKICSQKKARLPYNDMKLARVCDKCYDILESREDGGAEPSAESPWSPKRRGVLKVKASDPSLISGYLQLSSGQGRSWTKRWFAIHSDFVLYSFKAHQDIAALTSMPLPGMKVTQCQDDDNIDRENVFKVYHHNMKKNSYFLQADDTSTMNRWLQVLEKVVMMELPDDL